MTRIFAHVAIVLMTLLLLASLLFIGLLAIAGAFPGV
jgi:hypothetical protein